MNVPADCRFTKDHEWLKPLGSNRFRVGITDYAQTELGDVVFVDLPEVGASVSKGKGMSTVESVKAVSEVYAPIDGKIVEVNSALPDKPDSLNSDPYEAGWIVVIEASAANADSGLLDSAAYTAYLSEISK